MAKDKHKTNRIMKMKPGKTITGYMDLPTGTNYMSATSAYPCGPKENMIYSKCSTLLVNLLETLNTIHESKKEGGHPLDPLVKQQYQKLVVELRETVNRGAMPSTIEYIVNRLIRDLNNMVDKNVPEGYSVCEKLGEWYNVKRRTLLKTCAINVVINAFEAHGLMVQVVRVLNKLMTLPQYQRSVSIKRQFNPYFKGIEIAYSVANASIPKCSLDNDSTPSGLVRRTGPDVVSSSTKTADLPRPDLGPKLCPLQADVVSLWKLLGVPFDQNEFSATNEFFEDLNLSRFATRLRDAFAKVKFELTYVSANNNNMSARQIDVSRKLARFHANEAMNMNNDAKWFLNAQRQRKDQAAAILQGQQKDIAKLNEEYVKIDKEIDRYYAILKEAGPVPLLSTKARFATLQKKTVDAEKEVNKLRELIRKHEEAIELIEADFEIDITHAMMKLSDVEKEKARVIKECDFEKKLVEEVIRENAESAANTRGAQKRVKGLDVFSTVHQRIRRKLLRKMRNAEVQIESFTAALSVEADPKRREILSATLAEWQDTVERLRRAELDGDDEFRSRAEKVLKDEMPIEEALAMKGEEIKLPKRIQQLDLPQPTLSRLKLPTPIGPPRAAAEPKRTRFPIQADREYKGIPPIGVIPKNYVKKTGNTWVPRSSISDANPVTESSSNITVASQSSTSSFFSTNTCQSFFAPPPPPVDQSYQGSYYRSIVRPHLGPSMAKQFAKLQAQRRLPVPF